MDDVDLEMSLHNGWIRLGERSREESILIGSENENHKIELAGSVQRFVPRIQGPHEEDGPVMGKKVRTIHSLTEESQSLEPRDIAVVAPLLLGGLQPGQPLPAWPSACSKRGYSVLHQAVAGD
ncbi:hypothetical protein mRhiFer1_010293 [Rhinolophus ferrumequinum]|uniref:Uncharacterized protein n=1 Tax=Rhinolophus ferrumequinum TaxID=59479 RepID=A0A7J7X5F8_RHIFE|nr:hypothetical protein mRhiFer1_010293 [Rhinolophus ferrumequinum]